MLFTKIKKMVILFLNSCEKKKYAVTLSSERIRLVQVFVRAGRNTSLS